MKIWPWLIGGSTFAFVVIGATAIGGQSTSDSATGETGVYRAPVTEVAPQARNITIPNQVGKNGRLATDELTALGFTNLVTITRDPGESVVVLPEHWTVAALEPAPGTLVKSSDVVVLVMSKQPISAPVFVDEPTLATTFASGTHVVGEDIEAGTYKTAGPPGSIPCYWARLSDTSGSLTSIIANGAADGPTTVTISSSDNAFKASGSCEWVKK